MEAIFMVLAFVLLLIGGIAWAAGAPKRRAKRLIGVQVERARPVDVHQPERRRWLIEVTVTGTDQDALHCALSAHATSGDMVGEVIQARLKSAVSQLDEVPAQAHELAAALAAKLTPSLAADGLQCDGVEALGYIDDTVLKPLSRYVATEAYRRGLNVQLHCPVADLYLDGTTGRDEWSVECAPRPGAIVTTLSSVQLLRKRDHIMEVSKDGASIVTNRTLDQMLKGE